MCLDTLVLLVPVLLLELVVLAALTMVSLVLALPGVVGEMTWSAPQHCGHTLTTVGAEEDDDNNDNGDKDDDGWEEEEEEEKTGTQVVVVVLVVLDEDEEDVVFFSLNSEQCCLLPVVLPIMRWSVMYMWALVSERSLCRTWMSRLCCRESVLSMRTASSTSSTRMKPPAMGTAMTAALNQRSRSSERSEGWFMEYTALSLLLLLPGLAVEVGQGGDKEVFMSVHVWL